MRRLIARRSPALVLLALALAAGAVTAWALSPVKAPSAPTPATAPAPVVGPASATSSALAWRWQPGRVYRYALTYTAEQQVTRVAPGGQPMQAAGEVELALDWVVEPLGPIDGHLLMALRLERPAHHRIEMGDAAVLPDAEAARAALVEPRAWMAVDATGRVAGFYFSAEASTLYEQLVQTLAAEAELVLGPGERWSATQRTAHGASTSRYVARPAADGWSIERTRAPYDALAALPGAARIDSVSTARARVADAGHLSELTASERIDADGAEGAVAAGSRLSLTLRSITAGGAPMPDLAALTARAPGQVVPSADGQRRALIERADGMTPAGMLGDVLRFGAGGRLPDHNRWLWRATGLLTLDDRAAAALGARFDAAELGPRGRALIADLLASAGTPAAQTALRSALDGAAAHADPARGLLLQRLAFVEAPTAETVDWLTGEMANGPDRLAAATALGSAAGRVAGADSARSEAAVDALLGALEAAEAPEEAAALLRALGNAGQARALDAIAGQMDHAEPGVRAATATALRNIEGPRAARMLADLVADGAPMVQASALDAADDAFRTGRVEPELRAALAELAPGLDRNNHERIVGLLTRYGPIDSTTRAALEALRPLAERAVQATIDRALARAS